MPKLVAIVGQTASGKSDLALNIAKEFNGEIISADSRAIYRGMDIGTSKPSKTVQKQIKHYGLDLATPDNTYTVAEFQKYAEKAIENISNKGKLPIIVGGSGLYIDSVLFSYSFGSEPDEKKRRLLNNKSLAELQELAQEEGLGKEYLTLKNKRHLIRIIENKGQNTSDTKLRRNTLVLGIKLSKTQLRKRVEERVEYMFRRGLRKEVDKLQRQYGWEHEALSGIGYKESEPYYRGETSMSEVKRLIVKNTMNLAKRQNTWFKRNRNIIWIEDKEQAMAKIRAFLADKEYN